MADTLVDWLERRSQDHHSIAVTLVDPRMGSVDLRWPEIASDARRVASALVRHGAQPGDRVLIALRTGAPFIFCFYGCLMARAVPVPIYPPASPSQVRSFRETLFRFAAIAGAKLVITFDPLREFVAKERAGGDLLVVTWEGLSESEKDLEELDPPTVDDLALIQFSSGSTGDPRGICLTHDNLISNIGSFETSAGVTDRDVVASWLPLYHDMGLVGALLGTVVVGFRTVFASPDAFIRRPEIWLEMMSSHRATVSVVPQFAFNLCLRRLSLDGLRNVDLSSVRLILNGSEPIDAVACEAFEKRLAPLGLSAGVVTPCYGLAENGLAISFSRSVGLFQRTVSRSALERGLIRDGKGADARQVVSVGLPVAGTEVQVCGQAGQWLPPGRVGEICIRGRSTTTRVLTKSGPMPAADERGWLHTGDLGFFADGELVVIGRTKDLIIARGRNFFPQDLELEAAKVEGTRPGRVVAFGSRLALEGTEGVVVVSEVKGVATEHWSRRATEIRQRILSRFGIALLDVVLLEPGALPRTTSGKVRRFKARSHYEAHATEGVLFRLVPRSSLRRGSRRPRRAGPSQGDLSTGRD